MRDYAEFSSIEFNRFLLKQNRVGLLGGTFNPIHNGHLVMARIAYCEFALGEVVFLPSGDPPHKRDERIAPSRQRVDMIRLAIADTSCYSVNTMEIERDGYTYTVDTLEALKKQAGRNEYYYIIGADTLFQLHTWKNFERVICLTHFICVLRPGIDDAYAQAYAQALNEKYGHKVMIASEKGPHVSSSRIRDLASYGRLRHSLVPVDVADYINKNHVYFRED